MGRALFGTPTLTELHQPTRRKAVPVWLPIIIPMTVLLVAIPLARRGDAPRRATCLLGLALAPVPLALQSPALS